MSYCPNCGTENPANSQFCQTCGTGFSVSVPAAETTQGSPAVGPAETSGKAIGSLVCGILFLFLPVAIVAVILGHISLSEIRRSAGRLKGSGMAIAGLVLGYFGVAVIPILIIAAIAIPNLLRARMAANEASAVGSLRTITTAAVEYSATYGNGFPPSLATLGGATKQTTASCNEAQLIDTLLSGELSGRSPEKSGYRFTYQPGSSVPARAQGCSVPGVATFSIQADPITSGTMGQRHFFVDQTGVIRAEAEHPASADSPPLQ